MSAPHDRRARRTCALLVLFALVAACTGRGAEAAGEAAANFGEAMRVVVVILLVLTAIGVGIYVSIWAWFVAGWRRGRASPAAGLLLLLIHAGALVMAGIGPEEVAHRLLWWTAPLSAAAFAVAVAARLPARLGVGAVAAAGLWLLPAESPPMRALPAGVVGLSSAFMHACVVLRGGDLVCAGDQEATCDARADAFHRAPRRIAGLSAADGVYTTGGMSCVRRGAGPVLCCGGSSTLPAPRAPRGPWELPIGRSASALAVTEGQILAVTSDELQAWPHPLPEGLRTARALAASDGLEDHFAVVDRDGVLWLWRQDGAAVTRLAIFEGLADAEEVAVQARTGACVRRTGGAVACFPWPDSGDPRFEVPDLRAVQLVALDDAFDSFCARKADGAVVCWSEDDPPRSFAGLPTATRLVSTHSALCDLAGAVRCASTMFDVDAPLAQLLALPVKP